jgi:hypothetical protein
MTASAPDCSLAGLETITHDGRLFAYVLRASASVERTQFITPDELSLQLGLIVYKAGQGVIPHYHRPVERALHNTLEAILVRSGLCDVDIYDDAQQKIATRTLGTGDLVLLISGGHAFRMREDTILLEVKQGPYAGFDEKVRFHDSGQ